MARYHTLLAAFALTPEDVKAFQYAAQRTWNDIAFDVLQAVADDKHKAVEAVTVARNDVIELVLDAGRLDEHLRPRRNAMNDILPTDPLTPAARTFLTSYYLDQKSRDLMQLIMKDTFTYRSYGM